MSTVVVTDGDERAALAIVRSLGRAGSSVHVCATRSRSLAGASRYCSSSSIVANPLSEKDQFVGDVVKLCSRVRADLLFPVSEASLLAILAARDEFDARIPFPAAEVFENVSDKALVLERARTLGIPVPEQRMITGIPTATEISALPFPVVVKPTRSVPRQGERRRKGTVSYARNAKELVQILQELDSLSYPVLLQERIEGPGVAVSVLIWNGKLRDAFAHRRIREKPPSGGVSVLSEAIPLDARLLSQSASLLETFAWEGVAMVEYKIDSRTGTPYLMEINGRFWGSLQLAIDSGVDFPRLLLEAATGIAANAATQYRHGSKLRWEWGDVDNLIAMIRRNGSRSATQSWPGRARAITGFISAFRPGVRNEVLRLRDPAPFGRETIDWWKGVLS